MFARYRARTAAATSGRAGPPTEPRSVFAAIRREDWGIWTVNADGSNEQQIFGGVGTGYVNNPVWSPDGSLIAFVGNPSIDDYSPDDELYVTRPDGTGITPLADAPSIGVAGDIAWQPIPAQAVSAIDIPSRFFTPMPVVWRGQVWISTDPGVVRFDPLVESFPEPAVALPPRFGDCCGFLEADDRGIWFLSPVLDGGAGRVLDVFDPTTSEATALAALDEWTPVAMAVAPDAVWILNYEARSRTSISAERTEATMESWAAPYGASAIERSTALSARLSWGY